MWAEFIALKIRFALVENTKGETYDISLYLPAPRKFVCPNLQCIYVKVVSPRFCTAFWLKVAKLSLTIREYQISKHFWLCRLQKCSQLGFWKWDSAWILKRDSACISIMGINVSLKVGISLDFENGIHNGFLQVGISVDFKIGIQRGFWQWESAWTWKSASAWESAWMWKSASACVLKIKLESAWILNVGRSMGFKNGKWASILKMGIRSASFWKQRKMTQHKMT